MERVPRAQASAPATNPSIPVKVQRFMKVDAKFLNSMSYEDKELMFFIFGERDQNFLYPTLSAHYGRRISQVVMIMDFKKVSLMGTYFKLKEMFKVTSKVLSDYYPETLHTMLIINAGKWPSGLSAGYFFKGIWGMAKGFLDKDTQLKIKIEPKKGYKIIKKMLSDDSRIGAFMGGTATADLLTYPGNASEPMRRAFDEALVFNSDTRSLRKYFWEVDMSKPGNEFGVQIVEESKEKLGIGCQR